jgi:hypothetical protein
VQAKILRMSNDPQGAIAVLQRALEAPQTFVQADTLVSYILFLLFNLPLLSPSRYFTRCGPHLLSVIPNSVLI